MNTPALPPPTKNASPGQPELEPAKGLGVLGGSADLSLTAVLWVRSEPKGNL